MKILVLGGTGTVGSAVVPALVAKGHAVRVMTRSAEKARSAPEGIEARVGDLADPMGLGMAFDGIEAVFLLNAVSPTETQEGLAALNWAKTAGAVKIVYVSVQGCDVASHIPHFGSKVAVEHAIRLSGIDYTILRPNNFFQNDKWVRDALIQYGVYPQPIGEKGLSRVDVRDIADAAAGAFTDHGASNETFVVAGPDVLTGSQTASIYGHALGSGVVALDDLDAWEEQCREQMMPDWMMFDFRLMYEYFNAHGLIAPREAIAKTEKLMGHPARRFTAFVDEAVSAWRAAGVKEIQPKRHRC